MTEHPPIAQHPINIADPHSYDHRHANVQSGWLRAAVFGAMDGLVSNIALIAGIAGAGASARVITLTGVSGLIAGAISMALGEYTSVRTQNEQLDYEVHTESEALRRNPQGEELELIDQLVEIGMTHKTAQYAAAEVHGNHDSALRLHLSNELGLSVDERPSPWIAALSSLLAFGIGALIPVLPYLFGLTNILWALGFGATGLILAGGLAATFSRSGIAKNALRQLIFGGIAVSVTYALGMLLGVSSLG
jgi:VIT1/CCC1 family predicted Fe2+/Mn2+ transporter